MKAIRLERLLKLIQALESGRSQTAEDLAGIVGVSRQTVSRDLDLHWQVGLPYSYDHLTKKFSNDSRAHLPPVSRRRVDSRATTPALRDRDK